MGLADPPKEPDDLEDVLAELIGRAWARDAEEELARLGISPARAQELARARRGAPAVIEVKHGLDAVMLRRRER